MDGTTPVCVYHAVTIIEFRCGHSLIVLRLAFAGVIFA